MSTNPQPRIVFLVSQPRAGSTLVQRILASNSSVCTRSEGWALLRPLFEIGHRETSLVAPYNAAVAENATADFLEWLPRGRAAYFAGVNRMFTPIVEELLREERRTVFLDKTPRYYEILPELAETFPEARFLILYRNPLAVMRSLWATFLHRRWQGFGIFRRDLLVAPARLVESARHLEGRVLTLRYEDLVRDASTHVEEICSFIGVDYDPVMLDYGRAGVVSWRWGDPQSVYERTRPTDASVEAWWADVANPQFWRAASDYLELLGPELMQQMGYDCASLADQLHALRPSALSRWLTSSVGALLHATDPAMSCSLPDRLRARLVQLFWGAGSCSGPEQTNA